MFNLRRVVTVAVAAAVAMTTLAGPAGAESATAAAAKAAPKLVGTFAIVDSSGREVLKANTDALPTAPVTFGTPANVVPLAVSCDPWFEVHFTLTLGVTLLRWVHRVRSCVDGTNVVSLAERKETVIERALSIQVGALLSDRLNPGPPGTVVTSYYQRQFQYCSVGVLPCLLTYQPGNFIYALGNGQFLWNPAPYN